MGRKSCKALILVLCWLASCKKDKPDSTARITPGNTGSVYVVCEGRFMTGESTLYSYDPKTGSSSGDLYQGVNNQQLGDVFQSMARIGNRFFLCVNNSDKVVVLNAGNLMQSSVITIPKPRYVLPVSSSKAYVSSEYHNKVYVIDASSALVTDTIVLPYQNTEGMCAVNNAAFICTWDTSCKSIFKVDIATNQVLQEIKVAGYAPQEAVVDREQMLWVLSGNQPEGKNGALTRIDPSSGDVLASYQFTDSADAIKPVFNASKDTLYFIEANYYGGTSNNGIYRMGIHDQTLPVVPFVAAKTFEYFWALGIDPVTNYVYIGDPKGFIQKGVVFVYKPDGTAIDTFAVGLGPGHFYFDE